MKKTMAILKAVWAYTLGHPFTWDVLAGVALYTTMAMGWFKPWVPGCLLGYLLGRIYLLRKRLKKFDK